MRIGVADCAGAIVETIHRRLFQVLVMHSLGRIPFELRPRLVAIAARRGHMPAS